MRYGRRLWNCQFPWVALYYFIFKSSKNLFYFTIKILSFGVMNLIYTANVIFQVTFSVYRMILLPEAELASTVLSYTVKSFQANIWVSPATKKNRLNISKIFQVILGGTWWLARDIFRNRLSNVPKWLFSPNQGIRKPSWDCSQEGWYLVHPKGDRLVRKMGVKKWCPGRESNPRPTA